MDFQRAKHQLAKGEKWFRNTLSPIIGLKQWNYVGFVAFPNLENKGVLKKMGIHIENPKLLVNFKKNSI